MHTLGHLSTSHGHFGNKLSWGLIPWIKVGFRNCFVVLRNYIRIHFQKLIHGSEWCLLGLILGWQICQMSNEVQQFMSNLRNLADLPQCPQQMGFSLQLIFMRDPNCHPALNIILKGISAPTNLHEGSNLLPPLIDNAGFLLGPRLRIPHFDCFFRFRLPLASFSIILNTPVTDSPNQW